MTIGLIESQSGINILKMLEDELDVAIIEKEDQIKILENKITEKELDLLKLKSIRRRLQSGLHINEESTP